MNQGAFAVTACSWVTTASFNEQINNFHITKTKTVMNENIATKFYHCFHHLHMLLMLSASVKQTCNDNYSKKGKLNHVKNLENKNEAEVPYRYHILQSFQHWKFHTLHVNYSNKDTHMILLSYSSHLISTLFTYQNLSEDLK